MSIMESLRSTPAAWLLLATLITLPLGITAELVVLCGAALGVRALARGDIDTTRGEVRLALLLGLAYWLPEFISAWDSLAPRKSWTEVALDLRFLPFLVYIAARARAPGTAGALQAGIAGIVALWCLDALVQAATGWSLGGPAGADRLSGIFGAGNLKLGGVLAVLSPFLLLEAHRRAGGRGLALAILALLVVILLAGARAAWAGFALGAILLLWKRLPRRQAAAALLLLGLGALLAGSAGYLASERFAQRAERTASALSGDREAIDHALSGRLAIWETAWRMGLAHPINGVGVRAFRHAYAEHAAPDDPFIDAQTGQGALHAHQIVLEIWSETGFIGVSVWLIAILLAAGHWLGAGLAARQRALAAGIALCVAVFPFNTHYAMYSGFWGLLLVWLLATWLALLAADQS